MKPSFLMGTELLPQYDCWSFWTLVNSYFKRSWLSSYSSRQRNRLNLGYSHPVKIEIPETVSVEVVQNTTINLKSCDKELLGLFAANIRAYDVL
jgi:hypothetical protein